VVAFVRPADGRTPDPDGLRTYCHERLAPHKVPLLARSGRIPDNTVGQGSEVLLRGGSRPARAPTTAVSRPEELLSSLPWRSRPVGRGCRQLAVQATLGCRLEDVHGGTRFTDVGGDSLSALRLSRLLEGSSTSVPVGAVIDPTNDLDGLTNFIEKIAIPNGRPTFATVHGRAASEICQRPHLDRSSTPRR
jgi:fatty acid CoA ligase FadD9